MLRVNLLHLVAAMWFNSQHSSFNETLESIASSHPLTPEAGMRTLQNGENTADGDVSL
jgi:hypothetical protein